VRLPMLRYFLNASFLVAFLVVLILEVDTTLVVNRL